MLDNATIVSAAAGADEGTIDLLFQPGYEVLAYNSAVSPLWFYTGSGAGWVSRWPLSRAMNQKSGPRLLIRVTVPQISIGRIMDEHQLKVVNYHAKTTC